MALLTLAETGRSMYVWLTLPMNMPSMLTDAGIDMFSSTRNSDQKLNKAVWAETFQLAQGYLGSEVEEIKTASAFALGELSQSNGRSI